MMGILKLGELLRITDNCSSDCGKLGVVVDIATCYCTVQLFDGRKVRRSWGIEKVETQ
jgi:hypothetical protein